MKHVGIYTTPVCVYCKKAKDLFQKNGIQYEEYDVIKDVKRREDMITKTGQMGVPVIEIDGQFVV
ncbi:MAG: glutaredoxin domain-containing protein, partial [Patescibacteria group bacterium]